MPSPTAPAGAATKSSCSGQVRCSKGSSRAELISPELLIIDDFGLQKLTGEQAGDFYEVVIERYGKSSTAITSNRDVHEWMLLFDDSIMANSALDRIAHNAHQLVIEGESYRRKKEPQRRIKV
jgi:DNA replication protein DnaC